MLVGTPPFHGRAPQQLLAAQLTEPPPPIGHAPLRRAGRARAAHHAAAREGSGQASEDGERSRARRSRIRRSSAGRSPRRTRPRREQAEARALGAGGRGHSRVGRGGRRVVHESSPAGVTGAAATAVAGAPAAAAKSIAVMPLVNISRDTSDAYFAAGMTAEVTNALSRIPGLRVAIGNRERGARPSGESDGHRQGAQRNDGARRHGAARQEPPARDGAPRQHGRRIHGLVGHVRARVERRLQGAGRDLERRSSPRSRRSYRTPPRRDTAATATRRRVRGERSTARPTSQAYDLYLRGRYFFDKRGEAGLRRALDYFEQAAKKDSDFARAYAGIANVYALLPLYANVRVDSLMPLAMQAINRAVALDSTLAEAFASRATLLQASWRWADAERDYQRALALDPNYARGASVVRRAAAAQRPRPPTRRRSSSARPSSIRCRRSPTARTALALAVGARHRRVRSRPARRAVELDSTLLVTRFMLGAVYLAGAADCPTRFASSRRPTRLDPNSVQTLGPVRICICEIRQHAQAQTDIAKRSRSRAIGKMSGAGGGRGARLDRLSATTRVRSISSSAPSPITTRSSRANRSPRASSIRFAPIRGSRRSSRAPASTSA